VKGNRNEIAACDPSTARQCSKKEPQTIEIAPINSRPSRQPLAISIDNLRNR